HAGVFLVEAVERDRIIDLEELESGVAGADVGREEPLAQRIKGPVEFGVDAVSIAECEIGSPFGPVAGDVQEGQTPGFSEGHGLALGAVGLEAELKNRGRVALLVDGNNQPRLAVFFLQPIIDRLKVSDSS